MIKYYYVLLSCFLIVFSSGLFAQPSSMQLPAATGCTLNVPVNQRDIFLQQCIELARANHKEAQYQLGLYFSQNQLTPPDYIQAIYWFKSASSQAHANAQLQLGYMYLAGKGVSASNLQAYVIFKIASINGSDEAMDAADLVAHHMTPDELQQATIILGKTFRNYVVELSKH